MVIVLCVSALLVFCLACWGTAPGVGGFSKAHRVFDSQLQDAKERLRPVEDHGKGLAEHGKGLEEAVHGKKCPHCGKPI